MPADERPPPDFQMTDLLKPIQPVLLIFALTAAAQNVGFGPNLKCYQCASIVQPHCDDPFDNRTAILEPCPNDGLNYSRCLKKIIESKFTNILPLTDGLFTKR
ncbi:unnamed protein product [Schistocephalus solidus]|uniref:Protein quiver n=1 Tax=Schistocephalus solidus TaxID=70667 RepID=A0A183S9B2_SCHSO|nr:unnamed protein product [Schistocephalus solidus]